MKLNSININNYLKKKDSSYKLFDIYYNQTEKEIINNINILYTSFFSYYGKFNKDILMEGQYNLNGEYIDCNIIEYLIKICNNNKNEIILLKKIFYKIINKVVNGYGKKYIWFEIRTSLPTQFFEIPRWHYDGYKNQSKFITVLKGPGTLIIKDNDIISRKKYFEIEEKMFNEGKYKTIEEQIIINNKYRKILAKKLNPEIDQPNNNQGLIFLTNTAINNKLVGIHSEPKINKNRFFISIMCGTKNEIMNMHARKKIIKVKL